MSTPPVSAALPLDPGDILIAEFEAARAAALQANEDRARVTSYFLATAGSMAAAILSLHFDVAASPMPALGFAALFAALTWIGWTTLTQLADLRLAWIEGCRAMNQIKATYMAVLPGLEAAFRWTDATLPPAYKPRSLSSQLARIVVTVMGLSAASTTVFGALGLGPWFRFDQWRETPASVGLVIAAAAAGILVIWLGWRHYLRLLIAH
jgi:hypothetical protein